MKRLFLVALVLLPLFYTITDGYGAEEHRLLSSAEYRAKGYMYFNVVELSIGIPLFFQSRAVEFAMGYGKFLVGTELWRGTELSGLADYQDLQTGWLEDYLPLTLYYIMYSPGVIMGDRVWDLVFPIVSLYTTMNFWLCGLSMEPFSLDYPGSFFEAGFRIGAPLANLAVGYRTMQWVDYNNMHASYSTLFLSLNLQLASLWNYGIERIPEPIAGLSAIFNDADGNKIMGGNEEGELIATITNSGKGKVLEARLDISILETDYRDRINIEAFKALGNLDGYGNRSVPIDVKAKGELPKGKFTFKIVCSFKTEAGKTESLSEEVVVNTAPSTGMVRVAFKNLSSEGLPTWVIPTPLEYADYQVDYSQGKLTILNLNTGERKIQNVSSSTAARDFVKEFFLSWDRSSPNIILSSSGGDVKTERLKLRVRVSDDRKLDEMKVYLNNILHKVENFAELTETERELEFPLLMGDNTIRITLTDWVAKDDIKIVNFTRIRGGAGTTTAGVLPQGEPPPELTLQILPLDGNNTIVGGREEGIKVTVANRGRGIAKWVRVVLEGDEFIVSKWGKERNLEDIKPGDSKTAIFSLLMPTELQRREAEIQVSVKEGRGYSPTIRPSLTFSLIPAEVVEDTVEVVEDVDHDIPKGGITRKNGYALIIGLSKYQYANGPEHSKWDAEVFSKYASRVLGISDIKTLFDETATGSAIRSRLIDWLRKKRGFKVIYFAGHGVPDPENPREGEIYILPYDGDSELKTTLISLKEISELGSVKGDTVLIFLDACFSGSEGRTVQLASRPLVVSEIPKTDAIIFAAAEGNQPAKEFEMAKHGYFTYYTLLGLKGKADTIQKDGWITTTELYNFVKAEVSDATNNVQVPVLRPEKEIMIGRIK